MPSSEPSANPHLAQESSASSPAAAAAAAQEEAPPERVPEATAPGAEAEREEGNEEEEEEGECGFCLFMKGGGCKDAFVAWEKCVEASEKEGSDMVERCLEATANLKKCMDAHADYYAPVLEAEQAISDQVDASVAAVTPATDAAKDKGGEPASDAEKKEEAVTQ